MADAQYKNIEILPAGGHNVSLKLARVTGIDLKSAASTNLYTVPAGKTLYVTDVIVEITAVNTFATAATVEVGKTAAFDEWISATALTGLDTVGEFVSLASSAALVVHKTFAATEIVALNVTVGAGATTLTGAATIFGYLI